MKGTVDSTPEFKKAISRGQFPVFPGLQLILRIYVQYTSPYVIIPKVDNKEAVSLEDYSFRHVAIFENQLRLPPIGSLSLDRSIEER